MSPTKIENTVIKEVKKVSKLYLGDSPFILSTSPFELNFISPAKNWRAIRFRIKIIMLSQITNGSIDLNVFIKESISTLNSFILKILNILSNRNALNAEKEEEELFIPTSISETITIIRGQIC